MSRPSMDAEARPHGIRGILFDMDGTLVDSEIYTERSVLYLLQSQSLDPGDLDLCLFHGVTWESAERILKQRYPALEDEPVASLLQERFDRHCREDPLVLIEGAREALSRASSMYPLALVTSSNRQSVEYVLDRADLRGQFRLCVCAEDCARSKPDPECYLLAASRLSVEPRGCLVFEDSVAGLQAARGAGMWTVAVAGTIRKRGAVAGMADLTIGSYLDLEPDFFAGLR